MHPTASSPDYERPGRGPGKYVQILATDGRRCGGKERQAMDSDHFSFNVEDEAGNKYPRIRIYNTSRTATVYLRKR